MTTITTPEGLAAEIRRTIATHGQCHVTAWVWMKVMPAGLDIADFARALELDCVYLQREKLLIFRRASLAATLRALLGPHFPREIDEGCRVWGIVAMAVRRAREDGIRT